MAERSESQKEKNGEVGEVGNGEEILFQQVRSLQNNHLSTKQVFRDVVDERKRSQQQGVNCCFLLL